MDITPKFKKVMSKDEVGLLIDLIQNHPILTSKETNASTNKVKDDTWSNLTNIFNARCGSVPRTTSQLKLKWDNLKKAARKRTQQIRMNNLKTGGGKPDVIPADEMLEKVAGLLGTTCTGFVVPFGGDGIGGEEVLVQDTECLMDIEGSILLDNIDVNATRPCIEDVDEVESPNCTSTKRKVHFPVPESSKKSFFGSPLSNELRATKKGKKKEESAREARNLAIAEYYRKKAEKVDLEIKILKLELEDKQNKSHNNTYLLNLLKLELK